MATTVPTWNKGKAPAGNTGWQLTPDIRAGLESMNVVVPVANKAERDGITPPLGKYVGMVVSRADLNGLLEVWDGTRWESGPIGFLGEQSNAGATSTGTAQNALVTKTVNLEADRRIEIRATVTARPDTAALYGEYQIYAGGIALRTFVKRFNSVELGESLEFNADHGSGPGGATEFSLQCRVVDPPATTGLIKSAAFGVKIQIRDAGSS